LPVELVAFYGSTWLLLGLNIYKRSDESLKFCGGVDGRMSDLPWRIGWLYFRAGRRDPGMQLGHCTCVQWIPRAPQPPCSEMDPVALAGQGMEGAEMLFLLVLDLSLWYQLFPGLSFPACSLPAW